MGKGLRFYPKTFHIMRHIRLGPPQVVPGGPALFIVGIMSTTPVNLPPRKRRRPAVSEGGDSPHSAADSPVPATPSDRGAGPAVDGLQPCAGHVVDVETGARTKVQSRRTRKASEHPAQRAEGGTVAPPPDQATPGPSQSRDGEPPPRCPLSPNQPAAAFTAAALQERGMAMFLGEGARPRASGDTRKASAATLELILAVSFASEQLWKEREEEIKRACAPSLPTGLIDGQEVFGYLLADVLRRPLLHPEGRARRRWRLQQCRHKG